MWVRRPRRPPQPHPPPIPTQLHTLPYIAHCEFGSSAFCFVDRHWGRHISSPLSVQCMPPMSQAGRAAAAAAKAAGKGNGLQYPEGAGTWADEAGAGARADSGTSRAGLPRKGTKGPIDLNRVVAARRVPQADSGPGRATAAAASSGEPAAAGPAAAAGGFIIY